VSQAPDASVSLLDPRGQRATHPGFPSARTDAELAQDLADMTLARRLDTEATALQRQGQLALWPQSLGQEAAQIGSARALRPRDKVVPSFREHGVAWCLGVDPVELLSGFRCTSMIAWDPAATKPEFNLYSFYIGAQVPHAVGMGMAMRLDKMVGNPNEDDNGAVLVYFGDGATSEGDVHEAFVFAAAFNAPVVFFCQNNQWAISEPTALQANVPLYRRAAGYGFPGIRVDGNDVLAVHAVTSWAMERARRGDGPALIEAYTYRMGAHTTADDPTRYRLADEVESWRAKDPIDRVRAYLTERGAIDEAWERRLADESDALAARLRAGVVALPEPDLADWWQHVYTDTPASLLRERDEFVARRAEFAGAR